MTWNNSLRCRRLKTFFLTLSLLFSLSHSLTLSLSLSLPIFTSFTHMLTRFLCLISRFSFSKGSSLPYCKWITLSFPFSCLTLFTSVFLPSFPSVTFSRYLSFYSASMSSSQPSLSSVSSSFSLLCSNFFSLHFSFATTFAFLLLDPLIALLTKLLKAWHCKKVS